MNHPSIPSLSIQSSTTQKAPITLREGQMFHGQIKQLHPGQMAEVQIGGQKLIAKLEVPMKAGDAYYFQVKSLEPDLQLKVVSGPVQASEGQTKQLMNLMETMQLPKTQEMQMLLMHFMKNRIPISRENLLDAEKLLKTISTSMKNEAMTALQKLVEFRLPLTTANLTSLMAIETQEGLHSLLTSLKALLSEDSGVQQSLKQSILSSVESIGRITDVATEKALINGAIIKLLDESTSQGERFQLLQVLKTSGVLPPSTSLANLQSILHSSLLAQNQSGVQTTANLDESNRAMVESEITNSSFQKNDTQNSSLLNSWHSILKTGMQERPLEVTQLLNQMKNSIQIDPVLQQSQKIQLNGLIMEVEKLSFAELHTSTSSEQLTKMLIRIVAEQSQAQPFRQESTDVFQKLLQVDSSTTLSAIYRSIEKSNLPITNELIRDAQAAVGGAIDGKVIKEVMQSIFKSLGINYEAELMNRNTDLTKMTDLLKPQLLSLLQDSSVSLGVREVSEMIISRMNGSLLQSSEVGMNQQILMQLPLEFLGKRIDATLQWNGRMKENGEIDPDFARIMFYLDLESIKKTVIDMQVQNRVVTVTVFNENEQLKIIGDGLQEKLKNGLEAAGYILSGISFKNFEDKIKTAIRQQDQKQDQQGVDFRV